MEITVKLIHPHASVPSALSTMMLLRQSLTSLRVETGKTEGWQWSRFLKYCSRSVFRSYLASGKLEVGVKMFSCRDAALCQALGGIASGCVSLRAKPLLRTSCPKRTLLPEQIQARFISLINIILCCTRQQIYRDIKKLILFVRGQLEKSIFIVTFCRLNN